jgi:hypothetical protein
MQQPRGPDEEWGLAGTHRQKHDPQSPREVASIMTITVGLRGHSIPTQWRMDMLPCHLEKGR